VAEAENDPKLLVSGGFLAFGDLDTLKTLDGCHHEPPLYSLSAGMKRPVKA
jgi:hypothetical protein